MKREDLIRWEQGAGGAGALAARAADLIEAAREVPPLPPETLARIRVAVVERGRSRGGALRLGVRLALLAVALLASVTTARATITLWRRHRATIEALEAPAPPPAHRASRARPVRPAPPPPPVAPVAAAPPVRPARVAAHPRKIALAAPPVAPAPPPETEAQILAGAIARLRQAHDPAGTIRALDRYQAAYPHGVLEAEAASLRVEATLQLGDQRAALRLLDARAAFAGRLGQQQLLTRAELRASAGRYTEALADFDRALPGAAPAEAERALYGRAVCHGRLGHEERARADLTAYRQQFPAGRHAAEVARLLGAPERERRP
jgi:hypothetical protein